ncbi:MAG: hypothetical protein OEV21_06270, partial [Thermoplasmata archaeon]|nr:hypothetical protein [Thermoplasmata archaeon]
MGANKKKELENELSKLTILQLRQLSRKYSIDYTGSIRKNELIDKILASGVSLDNEPMISGGKKDDAEPPKAGAEAAPAVKAEPAKEALPLLKKEAAAPEVKKVEEPEKPAKKESAADKKAAEIREYINYMMNSKPSFFAIDGKLEAAAAMHNSGNYYGAIKEIQEARKLGSDIYSHFRIYTNALGINSAEKALEEAVKIGAISDDAAKKLLSSAMEGFVEGTPSKREHTLDKLESGAITVFDKIIGDLGKMIEVKQKKAEDLKQLGANVMEPSGLLL